MSADFTVTGRRVIFQGFTRLVEYRLRHLLPDGGMGPEIEREIFERPDAVAVLPFDPVRGEVVLVEQFRAATAISRGLPWSVEPPAGILAPGEDAEACARREVLEEAGLTVGRLVPAFEFFPSPGASSEFVRLFCGLVDAGQARAGGEASEHEWTRPVVLKLAEIMDFLGSARCNNAVTQISLMWLLLNRDRLAAAA